MKGLVVLTTVILALTSAQVHFPGAEDETSSGAALSGNSNSADVDSQLTDALTTSDRNFVFPQQQQTNADSCRQPDNSIGRCISFSQCSVFSGLAGNLNNPNTLKFLRQRVCRISGNSVQICCPGGNQPRPPVNAIPPNQRPFTPQTQRPFTPRPQVPSVSQNSKFPSDCGKAFSDRIIGGTEIAVGAYPWLVALGSPSFSGVFNVNCGGTLITHRHVLTAGHCFSGEFKPSHARVGEHDVTRDNDGAQPQTLLIINHELELYDEKNNHNDVALLTLEREVSFNSFIQPVCLPFREDLRNKNFLGQKLDVVGWGRTNHAIRQTSPIPLEAKVEVVTRKRCQDAYGKLEPPFNIIESQLCAGTGGTDSCNGDSGGPLHYFDGQSGRYYVVGVTSFGVECGRPDFPGVYARVGSYLDWLESKVN